MRRREFIAGLAGAAMWPMAARAQQANGRIARIAFLSVSSPQAFDPRSRGRARQAATALRCCATSTGTASRICAPPSSIT